MAEETIQILNLKVQGAESVADLRNNVTELKKALKEAEEQSNTPEGWAKYQETLEVLKQNQNALKDAMYATSGSLEDVKKSALGASTSYNSLVNKMAELKREFRATSDEARRMELGQQINDINDKLKEMDKLQGNFQRNVGNYKSALEGMIPPLKGINDSIGLIGKQPVLGIISLLLPLIKDITDELKENKTAMDAVKGLMKSLEPIMKFFEGALQKIAEWAGEALKGISQFVKTATPQLKSFVAGVTGVGNSIFQFLVMPIKQTIEAVKGLGNVLRDVFTGQWDKIKEDASKAVKGINDAFTKGIDFKGNYKIGEEAGEAFVDGLSSTKLKKKAKKEGKDLIKETLKGILAEFDKDVDEIFKEIDKKNEDLIKKELEKEEKLLEIARKRESDRLSALDKVAARQLKLNEIIAKDDEEKARNAYEIQQLAYEKRLAALSEFVDQAKERGDVESLVKYEQEIADTQVEIELATLREKKRIREEDKKNLMETLQASASFTSSILGTIADLYEADEKNSVKNANRVKALRIASATIETISGAIGAFMQASASYPPPYGQILGAIEAATITATGVANIAKMKATSVTDGNANADTTISAKTSAPTLTPNVTNVRSVTSASEEDRLNRMASDQRVYILADDIQASQNQIKTQVAESSF